MSRSSRSVSGMTHTMADPFGVADLRARILDSWAAPARFREDANAGAATPSAATQPCRRGTGRTPRTPPSAGRRDASFCGSAAEFTAANTGARSPPKA